MRTEDRGIAFCLEVVYNDGDEMSSAMFTQIYALQAELSISDAQLLLLARQIAGTASLRRIEDLLGCEALELLEELTALASIAA